MSSQEPMESTEAEDASSGPSQKPRKGVAFWLSLLALMVSIFLSALDLTAVATILPTITKDLHGDDNFVWVGSAFALSSTAILPLSGSLADIFGRKPIMLIAIVWFAVGSAIAGAARNMDMLIAARTIQGVGGGAIINLTDIIFSDLVSLAERGVYQGLLVLVWSFASAIGGLIGAAFAERVTWRWMFYINLPLTGVAFVLVFLFLKVRTPEGSMKEKLSRVDWSGNFILVAGTALVVTGLTFAGIHFPWSSAQVLAPVILGMALIFAFIMYEAKVPREPSIPWEILSNRTTLSAYVATFVHGITSISFIYYMPVFFQACFGAGPIRSALDTLVSSALIAPCALIGGVVVQLQNKYRPANYVGWMLTVVGFGMLTRLRADSSTGEWIGYQIIVAIGTGIIYSCTMFAVLAPLPVERVASALAFFAFVRAFAQTWGITIAGTILQNNLKKQLPGQFVSQFKQGSEIAYAAIPLIRGLEEPLRTQVKEAFALSMSDIWKTMIGISGIGIITLALLKEVPMVAHIDKTYGLQDEKLVRPDEEKIDGATVVLADARVKI